MNATLLIYGLLLLIFIRYVLFKIGRKKFENLINQFSGPRAYPIIGNIHMFLGSATDVLLRGKKLLNYESPVRLWLLHEPIVIIFDPENLQIVAKEALQKGKGYSFIKDIMGEGLITANGFFFFKLYHTPFTKTLVFRPNYIYVVEKWKSNRRLLNPAFNPTVLHQDFFKIFNEENEKLLRIFERKAVQKEEFDLWPLIVGSTASTISLTMMDYHDEYNQKMQDISYFGELLLRASSLVSRRIYKPWLHPQLFYNIYKYVHGYNRILEEVHNFPKKIIRRKKKELELEITSKNSDTDELTGKTGKSFLDIVLKNSKSHFSDDQLADELVTVLIAGSETTAVTVCSTLLMLAMHQHYQDKVYNELQNVFGEEKQIAGLKELDSLQFLEQCINETLRLFSSVPFMFRNIEEDITLKDGKNLPAGTTVCLAIVMLHHNPKLFPIPRRWNPNNFSPEAVNSRHKCSFVPFSEGPRSCIGSKYALLSIKVALTMILRKYKLRTNMTKKDIRPSFDIALRNLNGYRIWVEKR